MYTDNFNFIYQMSVCVCNVYENKDLFYILHLYNNVISKLIKIKNDVHIIKFYNMYTHNVLLYH